MGFKISTTKGRIVLAKRMPQTSIHNLQLFTANNFLLQIHTYPLKSSIAHIQSFLNSLGPCTDTLTSDDAQQLKRTYGRFRQSLETHILAIMSLVGPELILHCRPETSPKTVHHAIAQQTVSVLIVSSLKSTMQLHPGNDPLWIIKMVSKNSKKFRD